MKHTNLWKPWTRLWIFSRAITILVYRFRTCALYAIPKRWFWSTPAPRQECFHWIRYNFGKLCFCLSEFRVSDHNIDPYHYSLSPFPVLSSHLLMDLFYWRLTSPTRTLKFASLRIIWTPLVPSQGFHSARWICPLPTNGFSPPSTGQAST